VCPTEYGFACLIPGFDQLIEQVESARHPDVPCRGRPVQMNDRVHFPAKPKVGVIGLATDGDTLSNALAGRHGPVRRVRCRPRAGVQAGAGVRLDRACRRPEAGRDAAAFRLDRLVPEQVLDEENDEQSNNDVQQRQRAAEADLGHGRWSHDLSLRGCAGMGIRGGSEAGCGELPAGW